MKKLIALIAFLSCIFALNAQSFTKPKTVSDFYTVVKGSPEDTIGATQTSITKTYLINQSDALLYNITAKISDYAAGFTGTVVLKAKANIYSPWVTISTTTYTGAGTDTTITLSEVTTKKTYYIYQLVFNRTASKGKLDTLILSFKK